MPMLAANGLNNARPFKFSYADAAERTGDTGFVSADVGHFAFQEDDNSVWMLTATTPTWVQLLGGGLPAGGADGEVLTKQSGADGDADWEAPAGSAFVGARAHASALQAVAHNTVTPLNLDTEDWDTDAMHFTSAANLTGTVSKTAASATLTGSGTSFTSELTVGQVISVPGTAAEKRVVTAIASNTSLTVNAAFANSASGQTAARVNAAIVCRDAGKYEIKGHAQIDGTFTTSQLCVIFLQLNDTSTLQRWRGWAPNSPGGPLAIEQTLALWDFVELCAFQTTGSSKNTLADGPNASLSLRKIG